MTQFCLSIEGLVTYAEYQGLCCCDGSYEELAVGMLDNEGFCLDTITRFSDKVIEGTCHSQYPNLLKPSIVITLNDEGKIWFK